MSFYIQQRSIYISAYIASIWIGLLTGAIWWQIFIETSVKNQLDMKKLTIAAAICLALQALAIIRSPGSRIRIFLQIMGLNMMYFGIVNSLEIPVIILACIKYHRAIKFSEWCVLFFAIAMLYMTKYLFQRLRESDANHQKNVVDSSLAESGSAEFHRANVPSVRHEK